MPRRWSGLALWSASLLYLATALLLVIFGRFHVDEGFYHLIPRLVLEGKLPYRDFIYVQSPLYPLLYAPFYMLAQKLVTTRLLGALLGGLAVAGAALFARRLGGRSAALIAVALLASCPLFVYLMGIAKLYALCTVLVVGALLAFAAPRGRWGEDLAAGLFAALIVGVRLSMGLFGLGLVLLLAWRRRASPGRALLPLLAFALGLAAIFGPFLLTCPSELRWDMVTYHLVRDTFSLSRQVVYKLDNLFQVALSAPLLLLALVSAALLGRPGAAAPGAESPAAAGEGGYASPARLSDLWLLALLGLLPHLKAQVAFVYEYLVVLFPLLAILGGVGGAALYRRADAGSRRLFAALGASLVLLAWLGQLPLYLARPAGHSPVGYVDLVAARVAAATAPGARVLSFNHAVTVQAGRQVFPGDEMNVLTYQPDFDRERCRELHVLNLPMLEEAIRDRQFGALLITEHSFIGNFPVLYNPGEEGARPRIMRAIEQGYRLAQSFPGFGYLGERADLYLPR